MFKKIALPKDAILCVCGGEGEVENTNNEMAKHEMQTHCKESITNKIEWIMTEWIMHTYITHCL